MSFATLGLSPALVRAVREQGYHAPTAIQGAAIPPILAGRDVLGLAQTGSGKTAAFALPLLQRLRVPPAAGPRRLQALLLLPTRELVAQVGEVVREFARVLPQRLKIELAFGGVSINPQMMALRGGCDIMVATPGRLLDLIDHNALDLRSVEILVLDEADRLLDLGFAEELQRILSLLPARRQSLFFSATFPKAVQGLADGLLREPQRIEIAPEPQRSAAIVQRAIRVDESRRTPLLRHLLQTEEGWSRALVFVATRYATEHVSDKLWAHGIKAAALHGELSQGARSQVLAALRSGDIQVLVATDVAARGLDIAELPVVVNYDLPRSAADYTHRIGRTGRAGETGLAVSFVPASAEAHFRLIEKRQGQRVAREEVAGFAASPLSEAQELTLSQNGGVKGRRKSKKDKLREAAALAAGQPEAADQR
ncbi:DEAD/DEAH box helicase [Paucibacter sp. DJ2R-2]|uniref:DEAD/DEAH box helicase n=1 Tax=Paucibacter sp. DJ2R-2 TaxID=2893558 RepID=UPI0021E3A1EC|nr:DEAD/DEAH box helicase [Paucibacter sp. DJ2R-2]MCV2423455.1 DEAD/DEAH box helicase [Paucibacter sp. DJ4R-1]MCV2441332.1 DEAD/DEAH box helicase [Paucibacter sp. DJ2R-2]